MGASTIAWTDETWNPTTGCDRISPGCDNCYALSLARRWKAAGQPKYQNDGDPRTSGPGFGVTVHEDVISGPLRWRKPRMVFVDSMSDVGHARIPRWAVARIWAVMALTGRHQYQVLTKRPKRLATFLADPAFLLEVGQEATELIGSRPWQRWQLDLGGQRLAGDSGLGGGWTITDTEQGRLWVPPWPLPNVWVGTSIESDDYCWRADEIRQAPASVLFLSCEPLLTGLPSLDLTGIGWVIVGGESRTNADVRPMDLAWARDLRDRCRALDVPFFFKQTGSLLAHDLGLHGKGEDFDELPAGFRIRQYPTSPGGTTRWPRSTPRSTWRSRCCTRKAGWSSSRSTATPFGGSRSWFRTRPRASSDR
jgi:protein gp37